LRDPPVVSGTAALHTAADYPIRRKYRELHSDDDLAPHSVCIAAPQRKPTSSNIFV
jgi:hypothetical protein